MDENSWYTNWTNSAQAVTEEFEVSGRNRTPLENHQKEDEEWGIKLWSIFISSQKIKWFLGFICIYFLNICNILTVFDGTWHYFL